MWSLRQTLAGVAGIAVGLFILIGSMSVIGIVVGLVGGLHPDRLAVTGPLMLIVASGSAVLAGFVAATNSELPERVIGGGLVVAVCALIAAIDRMTSTEGGDDFLLGLAIFPQIMLGVFLRAAQRKSVSRKLIRAVGIAAFLMTCLIAGTGAFALSKDQEHSSVAVAPPVDVDESQPMRGIYGILDADGGYRQLEP